MQHQNGSVVPPRPQPQTTQTQGVPPSTASILRRPNGAPPVQGRNRGKTAGLSFLRSVGLKIFAFASKGERKKVVVSGSRMIAFARTGAHVFPVVITIFLIALNGNVLLNGPEISTPAVFFLQVAAKLHELTIVGSLTAIALDLVRYHALHEGINFGLISSGLSISTPSWLWTVDFLGGFGVSLSPQSTKTMIMNLPARTKTALKQTRKLGIRAAYSAMVRSKLFLCFVLVAFTLLGTTVGPASALLFIPTQHWIASARTYFYIRGTPDMLWPEVLGSNHTGVGLCSTSPIRIDMDSCLNGGWKKLVAAVERISPILPGWSLYIAGGSAYQVPPARTMYGGILALDDRGNAAPDTWATVAHAAVTSHADYLSHQATFAFGMAKGRNRRLRDFGTKDLMIATGGKFPVARVACSILTEMHGPDTLVPFPILTENVTWRLPFQQGPGLSKILNLTDLGVDSWDGIINLNATTEMQARVKWFPLPETLGSGSAAMLYLVQNHSRTYARGCVVEGWWATGQTLQSSQSVIFSWSVMPGFKPHRDGTEDINLEWEGGLRDPRFTPYYGKPIKIEQEWLDALAPMIPESSLAGNDLVMTSFEALLNQTYLNNLDMVLNNPTRSGLHLEYVTSMFFINALSRVGLMYQLVYAHDTVLDPLLLSKTLTDDSFISGKDIYDKRDPSEPFIQGRFESYKWGTAWTMAGATQQAAAAILCLHLVFALVHTVVLIYLGRSSEAWDSINEVMLLAYNSIPRPGAFQNCSSGIVHAHTLEKKIRIGTRTQDSGDVQSELVVCGDENGAGRIEVNEAYS